MIIKKLAGAVLNLLMPGLGHVYAQQVRRGIVFFILLYVSLIARRFVAFNFTLFAIWLGVLVIIYLYIVVRGYLDVGKPKPHTNSVLARPYVYAVVVVIVAISSYAVVSNAKMNVLAPLSFFRIPTPSMEPGLEIGDQVAVKRTKAVLRGDLTVFWFKGDMPPFDIETIYVMRCIGLPGDSVEIVKGSVEINGARLSEIPLKFSYYVKTDGTRLSDRLLDKLNIFEDDYYRMPENNYRMFLSEQQVVALKKFPFIKEVALLDESGPDDYIHGNKSWSSDFFGPLYIPKKGNKITLTEANINLYLNCIEHENEAVEKEIRGLKINSEKANEYVFKEDYFFMLGDNRHNAHDSRYWGFVPESRLIGKVAYMYWSRADDRIGKDFSTQPEGWN